MFETWGPSSQKSPSCLPMYWGQKMAPLSVPLGSMGIQNEARRLGTSESVGVPFRLRRVTPLAADLRKARSSGSRMVFRWFLGRSAISPAKSSLAADLRKAQIGNPRNPNESSTTPPCKSFRGSQHSPGQRNPFCTLWCSVSRASMHRSSMLPSARPRRA